MTQHPQTQQPDLPPSHDQPSQQHDALRPEPDSVPLQQDLPRSESESAPTVRTKTVQFILDEPQQPVSQEPAILANKSPLTPKESHVHYDDVKAEMTNSQSFCHFAINSWRRRALPEVPGRPIA